MSILLSVFLALIYFYLARFYRGRIEGWVLSIGWALVLVNLLRAFLGGLYRWDRQPFRRFELGLKDDRARPGQDFRLELILEARRSLTLAHLVAELRCLDEKVTERGRERRVLHEQRQVVSEALSVSPNDHHRFEVKLSVPPKGPSSFKDSVGRIRWSISVDADVVDWGVFHDEFEVAVAPS